MMLKAAGNLLAYCSFDVVAVIAVALPVRSKVAVSAVAEVHTNTMEEGSDW